MGRRGNKKHLKRLAAPKHWMLDKLSGVWAPRPSTGPHKLRECLPLILILRNRLKYALTGEEVRMILCNKLVRVDGKARLDPKYPAGFMDVITIPKTDEKFRLLYDVKGRFRLVRIDSNEANFKLCRIMKHQLGRGGVAYITTHDGRTLRFPDPEINVGDTVKLNLKTSKVEEIYSCEQEASVMIIKGRNTGRVGNIRKIEKHPGSHNIAHIRDAKGNDFATRMNNIFVIGGHDETAVTLPQGDGLKLTILQERQQSKAKRRRR